MLNISIILHQLGRKIAVFSLACLLVLISLPMNSVLADGYYSDKSHRIERVPPYYTAKDRKITKTEFSKPYYATKERQQSQAAKNNEDYIKTGRREKEATKLRNLETRSR